MIKSSVIHDTFTIERTFLATPSRVFGAFASADTSAYISRETEGVEKPAGDTAYELDFRVGGRERSIHKRNGKTYRYDALYYDIVTDQRIVYSYEIYANDARVSVSVATIEFAENGDGTTLVWTEQGAYLDGIDGAEAPRLREEGVAELLDKLAGYLNAREPR